MHPFELWQRPILIVVAIINFPCLILHADPPHERPRSVLVPTEGEIPDLHRAIESADDGRVAKLITEGADVNEKNTISQTPLMLAADRKNVGVVELLLKHGANPKANDRMGLTPLHYVARGEFCGNAQHGVDHEPFRNVADPKCLKLAEVLVAAGAVVDARSEDGSTPLHEATQSGLILLASFLLDHGANVNARSEGVGSTPLDRTLFCDRRGAHGPVECAKMAEFLISKGSSLREKDQLGDTPLQAAARDCNKDIAAVILKKDKEVQDQIDLALERVTSFLKAVEMTSSTSGPGALRMEALRKECIETQQLLLDAQAKK